MKGTTRTWSWLVFLMVLLAGIAGCSSETPSSPATTALTTTLTMSQGTTADATATATSASSGPAATMPESSQASTIATTSTTAATTPAATTAATAVTTAASTPVATTAPPASCTISVVCHTAVSYGLEGMPADGIILAPVDVPLLEGDTVLTVLVRAIAAANPVYGKSNVDVKSGAYVSGIGNDAMPMPLYEKDCGPESGWLYYINGTYVSLGASARLVGPGEIVEWKYTCTSGRDLG